ncbi:LysR family transcriptional regulator [Pedobacter aquae]|uniref:LysR family transcriptional regulator n=1 Tax=Pedobacter aquae TaxID=2605747 RepID=A0A5C0VGF7_9SPHI|nr:LysR family transcriptional regulator [Pedobacter aquae]QEK50953.1 LysR family transcriptional regulator [Pedobacter aquae]
MNYTLHQLQVFLKIVETKSITKAAHELFLTQPAVSIQFKNFQDQFDISLTEVVGKQVYITDFGFEIARMAQKILDEVNAINYKTQAYKGILSGRLKIAVVSTGKYIMPYFLTDFLKEHPGIDLTMDVTNKSKVLESLENNEVDFALVSVLPQRLAVNEEVLLEDNLYLLGNKEHQFNQGPYKKSIFNEIQLIYREVGSGTRFIMESFFEQSKVNVRKKLELTSNEAVKQAVIAGLGFSVMPLIGVHNEVMLKDLNIIPVAGLPIKTKWRMIWLKTKKLSPVAETFLDYTREHKKDIQDKSFSWVKELSLE